MSNPNNLRHDPFLRNRPIPPQRTPPDPPEEEDPGWPFLIVISLVVVAIAVALAIWLLH